LREQGEKKRLGEQTEGANEKKNYFLSKDRVSRKLKEKKKTSRGGDVAGEKGKRKVRSLGPALGKQKKKKKKSRRAP